MLTFESRRLSLLLCVLLACGPMSEPSGIGGSSAGSMAQAREAHTAALLPSGSDMLAPDLTPPETELDGASTPPAHSRLTSARFRFSSEPGASFQCSLDDAAFTPCISPQDYAALSDAPHTFQVRAIDTADNVDPTPAEYHWTVDTVPPLRPDFQVPRPNEEFLFSPPTFSGTTEPSSTVRVLVDDTEVGEALANEGGDWELIIPSPLAWGTHKVTATATDLAGNTSEPSMEVSFVLKRGLYAHGGCSAGPSAWVPWPWALVLLGLLRRRRPH